MKSLLETTLNSDRSWKSRNSQATQRSDRFATKFRGFHYTSSVEFTTKTHNSGKKTTHNFIIAKGQNEKQFPKEMWRKTGKLSEVTLLCFLPLASGWITFLAKQSIIVSQETCLSFIVHSEFLWAGGQDDSADNGTC